MNVYVEQSERSGTKHNVDKMCARRGDRIINEIV